MRLMIAPDRMQTTLFSEILLPSSSGISVSVAPAPMPMPSARWPAERPMAITKYHRKAVWESSIRFATSWPPSWRAVSNPKVGTPCGSGRSLSMVLGTWHTAILPAAAFSTCVAVKAVSSPPIVTRYFTPRSLSALTTLAIFSGLLVGFSRDVRMMEPPRVWMREISSGLSVRVCVLSPLASHLNPSYTPITSRPCFTASKVTALITPLIPGAGPPPTTTASFPPIIPPHGCDLSVFISAVIPAPTVAKQADIVNSETGLCQPRTDMSLPLPIEMFQCG